MAQTFSKLSKFAQVFQGTVTVTATKTAITDVRLADFISGYVVLTAINVSGTTPSITVVVESSPDAGVTYTAVPGASFVITAAGTFVVDVDEFGGSRLRARVTASTGTTPSADITVVAVAQRTHFLPWDGVVISA